MCIRDSTLAEQQPCTKLVGRSRQIGCQVTVMQTWYKKSIRNATWGKCIEIMEPASLTLFVALANAIYSHNGNLCFRSVVLRCWKEIKMNGKRSEQLIINTNNLHVYVMLMITIIQNALCIVRSILIQFSVGFSFGRKTRKHLFQQFCLITNWNHIVYRVCVHRCSQMAFAFIYEYMHMVEHDQCAQL